MNNKLILLFLGILLLSSFASAQNLAWVKAISGTGENESTSIIIDDSGNLYSCGWFEGTADFDLNTGTTNLTSAGKHDAFIQKLDASGNLVWAISFGGTENDIVNELAIDALGNVYATGSFAETVDFDPGTGTTSLTAVGGIDIFVMKLDASGNFLWVKSVGGSAREKGIGLALDNSDNVYTTGWFSGVIDFDPGAGTTNLISAGSFDIFIQKLGPSGDFLWAKTIGGPALDGGLAIAVDGSGNSYTTGWFSGMVDFDPNAAVSNISSAGDRDEFILKLDTAGDLVWAKGMGGADTDYAWSITVDASNNIYTAGIFAGTADFDPGTGVNNLTSAGSSDAFVQKLNASGDLVWAKSMGGADYDYATNVRVDASGNVYATGSFKGTADFDPGTGVNNLTSAGGAAFDAFIQKLDAAGDFVWAKNVGGTNTDGATATAVDAAGSTFTIGTFRNTADFDPNAGVTNLTSAGGSDIYILKLSANGNVAIENPLDSQIRLYPNPNNGIFSIELPPAARSAQVQIVDALGKLVHQTQLSQMTNRIDLSHLKTGIYHIDILLNDGAKFHGKLMLNK